MLNSTLERDGVNIAIVNTANSTPALYVDVANNRVGINTATSSTEFTVAGNAQISGMITANAFTGNGYGLTNINAGNIVGTYGNTNVANYLANGNDPTITNIENATANNITSINALQSNVVIINSNLINLNSDVANTNSNVATLITEVASLSGNVYTNANVASYLTTATGNITGNNISASGNVTVGKTTTLGNLTFTNTTINSTAAGNLVTIAGVSGLTLPVGNILQRPVAAPTGTVRFDTTSGNLELYNGASWVSLSTGNIGSITDQQITPDGTSSSYTLNQVATANSVIVSINGVVQLPTVAYAVSGTTITFVSIPLSTDVIDIRFVTYTTSIGSLSNDSGNSFVAVSNTPDITFGVSGNVAATINATGMLQIQRQGLQLPTYTVAQIAANITSPVPGQLIFTSNGDSGSQSLAVYDGSSWRRITLGATISAT